ncbi:hypothetical protein ACJ5NV_19950 [Loktanella agnita]|uniref:hypothetical protein n=1 Tax=Loktanella agnita TaxID=287097 RepID=UPI003988B0A4
MNGFFKGLLRFLRAVLSELAMIIVGGVLVVLGFAAVCYGVYLDSTLIIGAGSALMFVGFIMCMRHFV